MKASDLESILSILSDTSGPAETGLGERGSDRQRLRQSGTRDDELSKLKGVNEESRQSISTRNNSFTMFYILKTFCELQCRDGVEKWVSSTTPTTPCDMCATYSSFRPISRSSIKFLWSKICLREGPLRPLLLLQCRSVDRPRRTCPRCLADPKSLLAIHGTAPECLDPSSFFLVLCPSVRQSCPSAIPRNPLRE
jgi:hypothetical protein